LSFPSIQNENIQHPQHLWVAGWVQKGEAGYEILNAASAGKAPSCTIFGCCCRDFSDYTTGTNLNSGDDVLSSIKVNNTREFPITVRVYADQEQHHLRWLDIQNRAI
jgi:hypothetical protein